MTMLLERYYDDYLAQATYLVACERTGDAIVVDPNRDVDRYIRAAAAQRVRIRYVTETHIHADFLSGSRELARRTSAQLLLSAEGGPDWRYEFAEQDGARLLRDGDSIEVGKVRLDVLHTPGHTPEHICFVVTDTAAADRPMGIASGDFLFVGDVGRPDLMEKAANVAGTMERAARELYGSLGRLEQFGDYLQVWPGHGAGSACGKALGAVPQSTLGYERLFNPAFQLKSKTDFVRWVLAGQPEPPKYFAEMKRLNREGPLVDHSAAPVARLDAQDVLRAIAGGEWVIDTRGSADFAKEHLRGTVNIPLAKTFITYAGTVLSYDRPIALIAKDEDRAREVARQLSLIGLDHVSGWAAAAVLGDTRAAEGQVTSMPLVRPRELASRLDGNGTRVIDVRGRSEWDEGHLPKATHIFLGDLAERSAQLDRDEPIVVHCASGTRSSIGASLLRARGFKHVSNLAGGFDAWTRDGLPVVVN